MSTQMVSPAEPEAGSSRLTLGKLFLYALVVLSLIYYAVLMLDLLFHPLAINIDETIADRYLEALTGTGVIIVGAFIWRRVPANRIGPLLILYGVGVAGYSTRADLGSSQLTSIAHIFWQFYYGGVALPALIILVLSFPTGHIYPRHKSYFRTCTCSILYPVESDFRLQPFFLARNYWSNYLPHLALPSSSHT